MKDWLKEILDLGLVPYVSTSAHFADSLDFSLFEETHITRFLAEEDHKKFHDAYLLSNSLGFGNADLKMPNWVYIDCVLMQTAVVGFAIVVEKASDELLEFYRNDPSVDLDRLDYIPISGQIASMGIDGKTITGYSVFSLKKYVPEIKHIRLGSLTKYAALSVYQADKRERLMGIAQYDNHAVKLHATFGRKMYIEQPTMPLHPLKDMTFTYSMKAVFDEDRIFGGIKDDGKQPDFLMRADDLDMKKEMRKRMTNGEKFYIKDPIQIIKDGEVYLPICVE